jgi:hypothetical protein
MNKKMERRVFIRCKAGDNLSAELAAIEKVKIKGMSVDGLCLETSHIINPDTFCKIEIVSRNNEKITPKCVIVWSSHRRIVKEKDETFSIYGVGLKFIELTDSEKLFLEKCISEFAI